MKLIILLFAIFVCALAVPAPDAKDDVAFKTATVKDQVEKAQAELPKDEEKVPTQAEATAVSDNEDDAETQQGEESEEYLPEDEEYHDGEYGDDMGDADIDDEDQAEEVPENEEDVEEETSTEDAKAWKSPLHHDTPESTTEDKHEATPETEEELDEASDVPETEEDAESEAEETPPSIGGLRLRRLLMG